MNSSRISRLLKREKQTVLFAKTKPNKRKQSQNGQVQLEMHEEVVSLGNMAHTQIPPCASILNLHVRISLQMRSDSHTEQLRLGL